VAALACLCQSCTTQCSAFDPCNVCIDDAPLVILTTPPDKLSTTGLYADIASNTIAPYAKEYHPKYPLWSDDAAKIRHVYLPKCAQIDTSDMDHWQMPVGTRFWKEFTRDGVRVETRFMHRFGPGAEDWVFAAYQWNADQSEATYVPNGVSDPT